MPDAAPPRSGGSLPARIGRYRIVERVGRGAMGVVYAAHDDSMDRPVAIKVLMEDLESDPDTRARFYREAQAAAGLVHPNIITIFDAAEDRGRSYIVMQLLEGWPLRDYVKRPEAAPLERKLDLMVQICEGLAAAHARGIVHRDLKPSNLFVQSDGLLKILDFGIARVANSSMTRTGTVLGTLDYMSPEQARGEPVDARSDIFSVGAVFYYIVTGHKPFPGPDLSAVLRQLQFDPPTPIRDEEAPPELTQIILRAMAKHPGDRPPRIQDLLADLVRFRRYYQAETRRQAAAAGVRWDALLTMAAERGTLQHTLDADAPAGVLPALASLTARFPSLADKGGKALEGLPLDRAEVSELLGRLEGDAHAMMAELSRWRGFVEALHAGEQALAAGDARAALDILVRLEADCPESRRVRALAGECRGAVREQEHRARRADELVTAAQEAREARDWRRAVAAGEEALALVPDHGAARALVAEAQQALAREERRRRLLLDGHLDAAGQAIDEGRFADAEASLGAADTLDPGGAALQGLRDALAEARAAAAAAERLARLAAAEIVRARSLFRRGEYDRATEGLQRFVEAEPHAADAVAELHRLDVLRDRIARAAAHRRHRAHACITTAQTRAREGHLDAAVAEARRAVRADPSDPAAVDALDGLIDQALEWRVAAAHAETRAWRTEEAERLLAAARQAAGRGYVGVALATALNAARLDPAAPGADALVVELRQAAASDEEPAVFADDPFPGEVEETTPPAVQTTKAADLGEPPMPRSGLALAGQRVLEFFGWRASVR